jgi:hypothetical protein
MYADQGFPHGKPRCYRDEFLVTDVVDQISVISDMQALPTILTSSLKAANGSYTHAALNVAKTDVSKLAGPYFGGSDS